MKKVAVGVVVKDDHVLLIRRKHKEPGLDWCFPGGIVEENEEEQDAIIREILEETGIHCAVVRKLADEPHPVKTDLLKVFWLCDYVHGEATLKEPEKHEAVEWIPISELHRYLEADYRPFIQELFASHAKPKRNGPTIC